MLMKKKVAIFTPGEMAVITLKKDVVAGLTREDITVTIEG